MSIYDESKSLSMPKFSFGYDKLKFPLLAVIAVLIIAFLIIAFSSLFKPDPLLVSFSESSFDLSQEDKILMKVVVVNVSGEDAVDSVIKAKAVDSDSIVVFPEEVSVPVLGKGESRSFDFNLRALREDIPSGNYEINIGFLSNGRLFTKRVSIYVKNS
ncbi:hypothetical protein KKG83_02030 [Candidatus Micrarchaeota archaeon]|nr:hypothetical protein [Candidatus Micrarchaeota archaeon]MBU2476229.1 hypothetical protein [Candidatus Micrarchaeota archaeon]